MNLSLINDSIGFTNQSNQKYNWLVLSIVIFPLVGTIGNFLVCMAIARDHILQTKTNFYLFSLAISDLAVCMILSPFAIAKDFYGIWPFGHHLCILYLFLDVLLCSTSIYHLATVSILRFVAIQFPFKHNQLKSKSLTLTIVLVIWLIAALISCNVLFVAYLDISSVYNFQQCYLANDYFIIYGSILTFVIPLFIMFTMFILMARKLKKNAQSTKISRHLSVISQNSQAMNTLNNMKIVSDDESSIVFKKNENFRKHSMTASIYHVSSAPTQMNFTCVPKNTKDQNVKSALYNIAMNYSQFSFSLGGRKQRGSEAQRFSLSGRKHRGSEAQRFSLVNQYEIKSEEKAVHALFIVFIVFLIAWLPYCIANLSMAIFPKYQNSMSPFLNVFNYLGYFSSTLDPIIYTIYNRRFRKNFIEIVKCQKRKKRSHKRII